MDYARIQQPLWHQIQILDYQGFSHGRQALGRTDWYSGMIDCMAKVMKKEGVGGLYKGLAPGLAKAVLSTSLNFWFYERSCYVVALRHMNDDDGDN